VRNSRRWPGSSAVARLCLIGGGMGPEAMVVGEVEHWRRGGWASGTSGRTTGRPAGR
jgi:hypothetical protein